jgi:hypothetical protein
MPASGAYLLSQLSTAPSEHNAHNTCHKRACHKSQIPISRQAIRQSTKDGVSRKLHTEGRFFTGEIPFGLLVARWTGDKLGADAPFIDEVITVAQNLRGESFVDPTTGKINSDYCLKEKYTSGIPEASVE